MPVKKPAAKKATPAKKTAKSAAPALAKKVAAAKSKTPAKKSASAKSAAPTSEEGLAKRIAAAIKDGQFDAYLMEIDDALTARINRQASERATKNNRTAKTAEKKVAPAPKRTAPEKEEKPVNLVEGKTYQVKPTVKNIGGAKVKFHRFKVDAPGKAVIEMMEDKPGYPKGKRVAIASGSLIAVATKRAAAKRTAKK